MNDRLMKMMPMISCKKASHLISEGMDRRLSVGESIGLKIHLLMCGACAQILKQLKGLRKLLRAYRNHLMSKSNKSSSLSKETKHKIKEILMNS